MSEQKYVCENGSVGACAPALPFSFIPLPPSHGWGGGGVAAAPTVCNMPQAENHPINWAEGRALHAAEPTVIVSGKKAVAAMTCPGAIPLKTALRVANHDVAAETRV